MALASLLPLGRSYSETGTRSIADSAAGGQRHPLEWNSNVEEAPLQGLYPHMVMSSLLILQAIAASHSACCCW